MKLLLSILAIATIQSSSWFDMHCQWADKLGTIYISDIDGYWVNLYIKRPFHVNFMKDLKESRPKWQPLDRDAWPVPEIQVFPDAVPLDIKPVEYDAPFTPVSNVPRSTDH